MAGEMYKTADQLQTLGATSREDFVSIEHTSTSPELSQCSFPPFPCCFWSQRWAAPSYPLSSFPGGEELPATARQAPTENRSRQDVSAWLASWISSRMSYSNVKKNDAGRCPLVHKGEQKHLTIEVRFSCCLFHLLTDWRRIETQTTARRCLYELETISLGKTMVTDVLPQR